MKVKKLFAVAMATMMVMSMSITALADDNNGSTEGTGTSEGHVERKCTNVKLPTVDESTNIFNYTMDPERLIAETSNAKYGDDVLFPTGDDDKGVYFINGTNGNGKTVYTNSSNVLNAVNKSSHAINLTVTAEAVESAGGKDIPLVAQADLADATEASLYLGLTVGDTTKEITETAATQTVTLNGTPGNFIVAVNEDGDGYEYRVKTLAEWQGGDANKTQDEYDATWQKTIIALEGETTTGKAIASDTTAPKVKVTWSWVDPTANAGPSVAVSQYTLGTEDIVVTVNMGIGDLAATAITGVTKTDGTELAATNYTISGNTVTFSAAWATKIAGKLEAGGTSSYKIICDNDDEKSVTVTFKKPE
ncbi:hypothetical protein [Pseudobutyrivibrio sp. LB2011]|uniref:hypothetical protein n=1 Tax=Pseudobutyrivibrio sp. LB2011 TaxID=1408312 RepID=UPI0005D1F5DA|nr:hypothetical protein [Pseudobutyrivibrio sp. LB2011]